MIYYVAIVLPVMTVLVAILMHLMMMIHDGVSINISDNGGGIWWHMVVYINIIVGVGTYDVWYWCGGHMIILYQPEVFAGNSYH